MDFTVRSSHLQLGRISDFGYPGRMPKDEKMTEPVLVRLKPSMAQLLDAWRRDQVDLPTRAEAIRRLAAMALKTLKESEKPEPKAKGRKS